MLLRMPRSNTSDQCRNWRSGFASGPATADGEVLSMRACWNSYLRSQTKMMGKRRSALRRPINQGSIHHFVDNFLGSHSGFVFVNGHGEPQSGYQRVQRERRRNFRVQWNSPATIHDPQRHLDRPCILSNFSNGGQKLRVCALPPSQTNSCSKLLGMISESAA